MGAEQLPLVDRTTGAVGQVICGKTQQVLLVNAAAEKLVMNESNEMLLRFWPVIKSPLDVPAINKRPLYSLQSPYPMSKAFVALMWAMD